jgi:hypothetical protein
MAHEVSAQPAFDAQLALRKRMAWRWCGANQVTLLDMKKETAPATTVYADGGNLVQSSHF